MTTFRCPMCDREFAAERVTCMPFCSERCRLVDLGRWFNEEVALPVEPEDRGEDES